MKDPTKYITTTITKQNIIGKRESFIKREFVEIYNLLMKNYPTDLTWSERVYWWVNNINDYPKCPVCGKRLKFLGNYHGYQKYCSYKCAANSESTRNKAKETCKLKYGVENPFQSDKIKKKIKQTCLEKYGVENPVQSEIVRQKSINTCLEKYGVSSSNMCEWKKEKIKQTCLEKYGVTHISKSAEIKERVKQTCLEKYGASSYTQSTVYRKNSIKNYLSQHPEFIDELFENDDRYVIVRCPHLGCDKCKEKQYKISLTYYHNRKNLNIEPCTNILPIDSSGAFCHTKSTTLELFIHNILDKYNIEYTTNDRTILSGHKELDIYIPSKKLAIECNGVFWHSSEFKMNSYHYNKWSECSRMGVQLLTVWEDQIVHKPEIIESIILSKLGIYNERIGARKCEIREVSSHESTVFLNENHLQGNVNSRARLGLYYNNELVSLMTFGSKRRCMNGRNDQWELHRYCNKRGIQVVGGVSKLFKYFINTYNPTSIESFSSNDISNGELYRQLGFNDNGSQYGSYWYIEPSTMTRYHRYNFRKDVLIKEGYDPSKSEFQIMSELGYYRIYDSGQTKWSFKLL